MTASGPPAELRTALAGPLAASTVSHALGLAGPDGISTELLLGWYRAIVDSVSLTAAGCPVTAAGGAAMSELDASLRRRLESGGTSSPLSASMTECGLDSAEAVSNAAVIMFGGIETTEGMLLNAVWHLLHEPERFAAVRHDSSW